MPLDSQSPVILILSILTDWPKLFNATSSTWYFWLYPVHQHHEGFWSRIFYWPVSIAQPTASSTKGRNTDGSKSHIESQKSWKMFRDDHQPRPRVHLVTNNNTIIIQIGAKMAIKSTAVALAQFGLLYGPW